MRIWQMAVASFEAFTAVMFQVEVFCVVKPCSVVVGDQRFRGPCCLHLDGEVLFPWYQHRHNFHAYVHYNFPLAWTLTALLVSCIRHPGNFPRCSYENNTQFASFFHIKTTRVYPKLSGLASWRENCKCYSSLPRGAVVSLFCVITFCVASQRIFILVVFLFHYRLNPETFGYTFV
jgi:hypothetical protein